jgi:hypothetical protein
MPIYQYLSAQVPEKRTSKSGKLLDVTLTIVPVRNSTGEIVGLLKSCATFRNANDSKKGSIDFEKMAETAAIIESSDDDAILSKERIDHFETVRLTKDVLRLNVSLTVSPVKDEQGQVIGARISASIVRFDDGCMLRCCLWSRAIEDVFVRCVRELSLRLQLSYS